MQESPLTYLSEAEVSARLGVSRITLLRWRKKGIGPVFARLGPRRLAYGAAQLEAWLKAQERAPIANAA